MTHFVKQESRNTAKSRLEDVKRAFCITSCDWSVGLIITTRDEEEMRKELCITSCDWSVGLMITTRDKGRPLCHQSDWWLQQEMKKAFWITTCYRSVGLMITRRDEESGLWLVSRTDDYNKKYGKTFVSPAITGQSDWWLQEMRKAFCVTICDWSVGLMISTRDKGRPLCHQLLLVSRTDDYNNNIMNTFCHQLLLVSRTDVYEVSMETDIEERKFIRSFKVFISNQLCFYYWKYLDTCNDRSSTVIFAPTALRSMAVKLHRQW